MSGGFCSFLSDALSTINKCDTRVRKTSTEQFHDMIHGLETFDLVLTSSVGLMSFVIQFGTRSRFTHVGLIVRGHPFCGYAHRKRYPVICDRDCLNQVTVWESNVYDYHTDIKTGNKTTGTHLVMLMDMISQDYIKTYAFRKMTTTRLHPAIEKTRIDCLNRFIDENYNKQYDKNWISALLKFGTSPFTSERFFCSSLIAATLFECGIFRYNIGPELGNPAEFSPSSFEEGSKLPVHDVVYSPLLFYGSPPDMNYISSFPELGQSFPKYYFSSSGECVRLPECPKIFTPKIKKFSV